MKGFNFKTAFALILGLSLGVQTFASESSFNQFIGSYEGNDIASGKKGINCTLEIEYHEGYGLFPYYSFEITDDKFSSKANVSARRLKKEYSELLEITPINDFEHKKIELDAHSDDTAEQVVTVTFSAPNQIKTVAINNNFGGGLYRNKGRTDFCKVINKLSN